MSQQRLQLAWYNKDMALIPTETGKYGYQWVDPADPRYCETHMLVLDEYVEGKQTPPGTTSSSIPSVPTWSRKPITFLSTASPVMCWRR